MSHIYDVSGRCFILEGMDYLMACAKAIELKEKNKSRYIVFRWEWDTNELKETEDISFCSLVA